MCGGAFPDLEISGGRSYLNFKIDVVWYGGKLVLAIAAYILKLVLLPSVPTLERVSVL